MSKLEIDFPTVHNDFLIGSQVHVPTEKSAFIRMPSNNSFHPSGKDDPSRYRNPKQKYHEDDSLEEEEEEDEEKDDVDDNILNDQRVL